ncbi:MULTISPECIES: MarR family transcriptional regulator [Thermocrispum]|jgi:DNA-binding MarR family transcriptional regulator|uniref:MarR family transcriptional regulator n=1 Tax=Thermocrispum agreste TaxID=37925 RepID=A0A2W4L3B7_9PSEU|nr:MULTISPECIES: MarR family transcriptional regulator [Thermocrispum]PZM90076.1 MAG: MarR family transcriptional regulator [Thermocrispum agreste]
MSGTATPTDLSATVTDSTGGMPPEKMVSAERLGDTFSRLIRVLTKAKFRMSSELPEIEPSAFPILAVLHREGPSRTSTIAERVHADVSTISRQTSALVQAGFIERQADPNDGRACLLALTEAGHEIHERVRAVRNRWLATILQHWPDDDVDRLVTLLGRLSDDITRNLAATEPSAERNRASHTERTA